MYMQAVQTHDKQGLRTICAGIQMVSRVDGVLQLEVVFVQMQELRMHVCAQAVHT